MTAAEAQQRFLDWLAHEKRASPHTVAAYRDGDARIETGGFPGRVEAKVKTAADGYEAEVRIPLSAIPNFKVADGGKIGFDISIEDSDASARKTEIVWSGTADNWKNRSQFGIVQFKKTGTP